MILHRVGQNDTTFSDHFKSILLLSSLERLLPSDEWVRLAFAISTISGDAVLEDFLFDVAFEDLPSLDS